MAISPETSLSKTNEKTGNMVYIVAYLQGEEKKNDSR